MHQRLLLPLLLIIASCSHAEVNARRTLVNFGPAERWRIHGTGRELATLKTAENGASLELAPVAKDTHIPLIARKFSIHPLGSVAQLELVADLETGEGVAFNVRLRDRDGEIGQVPLRTLKPGKNVLSWTLPEGLRFRGTWGPKDKLNGILEPPLHLHELFLIRQQSATPARVRLHALRAVDICAPAQAITAELEAGNEIHVIDVFEKDQIPALILTSAADTPIALTVKVRMTDFDGETMDLAEKVTVPAMGTARMPLPRPMWHGVLTKRGIFYVNYELSDADGTKKEGTRSFAIMAPAGPTGVKNPPPDPMGGGGMGGPHRAQETGEEAPEPFLFSICTHTERWGARDQRLEVMAAGMCGAKVIRTGSGWGSIERQEGEFDWSQFDRIVKMYGDQGMEIQCLLAFTPRWAAAPEKRGAKDWHEWNNSMPREDAWRNWVRAMAKRYGDRIRYWEVWNEPDIGFWRGTLDEYLVLLQAAYEEIKGADPKLQVMTGGFAAYHRNPAFMEGVIQRGQQWFDIFAHHRHGNFRGFQQEVDGPIAKLRSQLKPPKPIYFNETAIASIGIGERGQAETLVKKLTLAWARGAMGYTWYDLRNDGFDPHEFEHNYGMVTNDFYPKAVYVAYNTLVTHLGGRTFVKQLDLGADRWGFVFAVANSTVIVAWNESPTAVDEYYLLAANEVRLPKTLRIDMMGNLSPYPMVVGNRVALPLSRTPRLLWVRGHHPDLRVLGPELNLEAISPAVPGQTVRAVLAIHNLYTQSREYVANWQLPKELGSGTGEQRVTIPADTLGKLALKIPIPGTLRGQYGSSFRAKLSIGGAGHEPFAKMDVPIPLAAYVPKDSAAPVFRLDKRARVTSLFTADPNKKHLVWTGAKDLSVRASLRLLADRILLRVHVEDDIHHQPKRGKDVWQGDGIQLVLAVPGQQGFWEIGLTQLADGTPEVACWHRANGFADPSAKVNLKTVERGTSIEYVASLPLRAFGLTPKHLHEGIRLSFLVNDNDGEGREGWMALSDGIGVRKDPQRFPFVVFE
jgi:hypothetical protein